MSWELTDRAHRADYTHNEDVLVAFVHWRCVERGLCSVGLGDDFRFAADETLSDLLPDNWNADKEGRIYAIRYRMKEHKEKKFLLKAIVSDDSVIATLVRVADEKPFTVTLFKKTAIEVKNHKMTIKDVKGLSEQIDKDLLSEAVEVSRPASPPRPQRNDPLREPLAVGPPTGGRLEPAVPMGFPDFAGDLDPLGRGGGGMLMPGPGEIRQPGARFDPVFPHLPDLMMGPGQGRGGMPGRGRGRGGGRGGFGDEMPPPGFDDMFG